MNTMYLFKYVKKLLMSPKTAESAKLQRAELAPLIPEINWNYPPDFCIQTQNICNAVRPFTMTSPERIYALVEAVQYLVLNEVAGALVECGVWRGGSMMAAALTLMQTGDVSRELYLYDTYAGMPPPGEKDRSIDGIAAKKRFPAEKEHKNPAHWSRCYSSLDEVQNNIFSTGYPKDKVRFIVGRVEDTIPGQMPNKIALLRLDTDWYESTRHEIIHLYPRLQTGGVLIIDDYGHWEGQRKAIDEFIAERKLKLLLNRVDYTGRIAVKLPEA